MKYLLTAVLALLGGTAQAAQFRGILATDILPTGFGVPIVNVATMSGNGSTLGGSIRLTGVDFDCAAFDCGTSGFVLPLVEMHPRNLGRLDLGGSILASPKQVTSLSFDGSQAIVQYGFLRYESALHRGGSPIAFRDPTITSENEWLFAAGMTPDADVVVGTLGTTPFRWSESGGFEGFEGFEGIDADSGYTPTGISHDGSTTLLNNRGVNYFPSLIIGAVQENALAWTEATGPIELAPISGYSRSGATASSSDGSTIVGSSYHDQDSSMLRYERATAWIEAQPIPLAAIADYSSALDVSANGEAIVGAAGLSNGGTDVFSYPEAVLWKNNSAYLLKDLLTTEYGLGEALEGWRLTSATAISDDGTVIAGNDFAPDGSSAAWVVVLAVPEPASVVLAIVASIAVIGFAGRKEKERRIGRG